MKRIVAVAGLLISFACAQALADPVRITVTGEVTYSYDSNGDAFGFGSGTNHFNGATVTSVFEFDTDDIPTDRQSLTQIGDYRDSDAQGDDWMTNTVTLDFSTVRTTAPDQASVEDPNYEWDRIYVRNNFRGVDRVLLQSYNYRSTPYSYVNSYIDWYGYNRFVTGLDPLATLESLTTTSGDRWNLGVYRLYNSDPNLNAGFNYSLMSYSFEYTDVPEPGTLLLLGAGLAGMGLARRRRTV